MKWNVTKYSSDDLVWLLSPLHEFHCAVMILLSNEQVIKLGAAVTYFPSNGAIDVGVAVTGELGLVVKLVKI